ncbi:MAG: hypothetical protein QME47_07200 [Candidatus Thermoplasmatota archaeon]|nr:hypothetical protein [Candidatus Thermoplasmatota archaeon]
MYTYYAHTSGFTHTEIAEKVGKDKTDKTIEKVIKETVGTKGEVVLVNSATDDYYNRILEIEFRYPQKDDKLISKINSKLEKVFKTKFYEEEELLVLKRIIEDKRKKITFSECPRCNEHYFHDRLIRYDNGIKTITLAISWCPCKYKRFANQKLIERDYPELMWYQLAVDSYYFIGFEELSVPEELVYRWQSGESSEKVLERWLRNVKKSVAEITVLLSFARDREPFLEEPNKTRCFRYLICFFKIADKWRRYPSQAHNEASAAREQEWIFDNLFPTFKGKVTTYAFASDWHSTLYYLGKKDGYSRETMHDFYNLSKKMEE